MKEITIDIHFGGFGEECSDRDHWINMVVDGKCFRCQKGLAPYIPASELPPLPFPSEDEINAMASAACYECVRDGQPCEEHQKVGTASQAYRDSH